MEGVLRMREKVVYSLKYILGDKKEISIPSAGSKGWNFVSLSKEKEMH